MSTFVIFPYKRPPPSPQHAHVFVSPSGAPSDVHGAHPVSPSPVRTSARMLIAPSPPRTKSLRARCSRRGEWGAAGRRAGADEWVGVRSGGSRRGRGRLGGYKTRTGRATRCSAEADRHEQEHEQEQDKHAQHKHEQELSPSGRQWRPSSSAPSPSSPTPSCWGRRSEGETSARRRGAPGDARSETATGRDAIHERTLQTRSPKSFFSLGQLPSRRPPGSTKRGVKKGNRLCCNRAASGRGWKRFY